MSGKADLVEEVAQAIRDSNGKPEALAWWQEHPQIIPAHVYAEAAVKAVADATGEWMKPEEVCDWLSVKRDWLYDAVQSNKIPHIKIGRMLRFKRLELVEWAESYRVG